MSDRRPLLVGECNPYGGEESWALSPHPEGSAGWRLCHLVMGLEEDEYLELFSRTNLCDKVWDLKKARARAAEIREQGWPRIVLLGRRVAQAFQIGWWDLFTVERSWVLLPHPSSRCRAWNQPGAYERAREALRRGGVL